MTTLRPYQQGAREAVNAFIAGSGISALLDLPGGTGKSVLIARLIADHPSRRLLVTAPTRELIEQNVRALRAIAPGAPYGINSAALGQRAWDAQTIFATVQSIYKRPEKLGNVDLFVADEAHKIPHREDGMYRGLIAGLRKINPSLRVIGYTATPYRLDTGRLDQGKDRIFDRIIFSYGYLEAFRDGWLAPLSSKKPKSEIDVSGVGRLGGDFILHELEAAADNMALIRAAVGETVERGGNRRAWLVFCVGTRHARHTRDEFRRCGIAAELVTGQTRAQERAEIIRRFRAGELRCLVNVLVLTTGFDVPEIDLVAMMRPTLSTSLYVQMVCRGTRLATGKTDCLVLDFAANVRRHGPIDCVRPKRADAKPKGDNGRVRVDEVRAKACPGCDELCESQATVCVKCGFQWLPPESKVRIAPTADDAPILSPSEDEWLDVTHVSFRLHHKQASPSAPPTLRVTYCCGISLYSEYLSFGRDGWAGQYARRWWFAMGGRYPCPDNAEVALSRTGELTKAQQITVIVNGSYLNVSNRSFLRGGQRFVVDSKYRVRAAA